MSILDLAPKDNQLLDDQGYWTEEQRREISAKEKEIYAVVMAETEGEQKRLRVTQNVVGHAIGDGNKVMFLIRNNNILISLRCSDGLKKKMIAREGEHVKHCAVHNCKRVFFNMNKSEQHDCY